MPDKTIVAGDLPVIWLYAMPEHNEKLKASPVYLGGHDERIVRIVATDEPDSGEPFAVVLHSDATAALAQKDGEIAAMRSALSEFDSAFTEFDPSSFASRHRMRLAVIAARAALGSKA